MSRLIDADALKEFIDDCGICAICPQKAPRCSYDCDFPECVTEKWNVAIDAQPTIDAVSVVRCKDCRYAEVYDGYYTQVCCENGVIGGHVELWNPDDFCSYGEKETDHE